MIGTTISLRFSAFVLSVVFAVSGGSAQIRSNISPDAGPRPAVVNVDILRHPITPKVRHLIEKAMEKMESGEDEAAIEQLLETLAKYPESAAYVYNLLGVAYTKTDQVKAAVSSFEQAALLLPHDAMTHYYFGLALVCVTIMTARHRRFNGRSNWIRRTSKYKSDSTQSCTTNLL